MEFIQSRCRFSEGDEKSIALIAELLDTLNSCSRRVFSRSISQVLPPQSMTDAWGIKAGVFVQANLTHHQRSMMIRHAANLRKAANARSEYLADI